MMDSDQTKCPVCGRHDWRTVINTPNFRIDECIGGCIGRTLPPPKFTDELPPGACADNIKKLDRNAPGHFTFADEILDWVGKFQPNGRLLDIGPGWGQLLRSGLDRGYEAVGIEASPSVAEIAREAFDVEVVVGSFPEYNFEIDSFDIVTMNHVLEHLYKPEEALREAYRILKPGGILAVMSPNYQSLMRILMRSKWCGLQPSQHVWQLSVRSVRELMMCASLAPMVVRKIDLDYGLVFRPPVNRFRLRTVLAFANALNMGDNMLVLARKLVR